LLAEIPGLRAANCPHQGECASRKRGFGVFYSALRGSVQRLPAGHTLSQKLHKSEILLYPSGSSFRPHSQFCHGWPSCFGGEPKERFL
jgi:hypothetical protein